MDKKDFLGAFDRTKILDSALDVIGGTPMIRLDRLAKAEGIECELLAKCEFFNSGGSVKDRIAKEMLLRALEDGTINEETLIIEPTSGNTGLGLALCAAILGLKSLMVLPEKMSDEKVMLLKSLGSQVIRTPTEAAYDSPESHISIARKINKETPNSWIPDQYTNVNNWLCHYDYTAEEILHQCDNKIDAIVIGAGTGGTITGISKKIKEVLPETKIIGVDPEGSILAESNRKLTSEEDKPYLVEGIGYDFIPDTLHYDGIDYWIKSNDKTAFELSRKLIRLEGLLCGGSSGSNLYAALKVARNYKKGQRVVVILPDTIRNYMSKHLNYDWLIYQKVAEPDYRPLNNTKKFGDLDPTVKVTALDHVLCPLVDENDTIDSVLKTLSIKKISHVIIIKECDYSKPLFAIDNDVLIEIIANGHSPITTKISDVRKYISSRPELVNPIIVNYDLPLFEAVKIIAKAKYAIIIPENVSYEFPSLRIVTTDTLIRFSAKYGVRFGSS